MPTLFGCPAPLGSTPWLVRRFRLRREGKGREGEGGEGEGKGREGKGPDLGPTGRHGRWPMEISIQKRELSG